MQSIKTRDIIEIVGILSIVASLIFVGMQLKQDEIIAMGSQYQSRAELSIDNYRSVLENPELLAATVKANRGDVESFTPEEKLAYDTKLTMDFIRLDNNFYQYELGLSDETYWENSRIRTKTRLQSEYTRKHYLEIVTARRSPLGQLILQLIAEIDAE